jgi:periplasmic protein TonB
MSYAISNADQLPFKRYLSYSVYLHLSLTALMLIGIWVQRSGERWGGIGGGADSGVKVNLVSSAGIPMPNPTNVTESEVMDPSKSLHKEEPKPEPKPPEPKTDAAKIPKFEKEKPLPPSPKSRVFESKTSEPENAIPGKGGSPNVSSGYSNTPGPMSGGIAAKGEGGGEFAGRYPWYVQSVVRAITQNWFQNTIDPSVRAARRAKTVATFTINRDGTVKNIRISESSGNRSLDDSAQRALLSIDHFPPLPADFPGRYVDVTFDFDLSMTR